MPPFPEGWTPFWRKPLPKHLPNVSPIVASSSARWHRPSPAHPQLRLARLPWVVAQPTQPVIPVPEPAGPAKRSRPAVLAAVVAVLGLGGALAVWKPWNRSPQPPDRVADVRPATATPVPTREPVAPRPVAPPKPQPHDAKPASRLTPPTVTPPPAAEGPCQPSNRRKRLPLPKLPALRCQADRGRSTRRG